MASLKNNPSPSLPQLHTTLASLQTATHILTGLTHRNKNQHRSSKWWAPFSILRRCLQKLVPDLQAAIQRAEMALPPPQPGHNKPPRTYQIKAKAKMAATTTTTTTTTPPRLPPELARVVERAMWMKEAALADRAYAAFSQLTADRQFAPLGLVLLGVLAQVEAALAPWVPDPSEPAQPAAGETLGAAVGAGRPAAVVAARHGGTPGCGGAGGGGVVEGQEKEVKDEDLGVAVSRDELDGGKQRQQPFVARGSAASMARGAPAAERQDVGLHGTTSRLKRKKQRMVDDDDGDGDDDVEIRTSVGLEAGMFLGEEPVKKPKLRDDDGEGRARGKDTAKTVALDEPEEGQNHTIIEKTATKKKKKTTKKARKKGGDEFDDLFSSLL